MMFTKENLFTQPDKFDEEIQKRAMEKIMADDEIRPLFLGEDVPGFEQECENAREFCKTFLHPEEIKWFDSIHEKCVSAGIYKSVGHGYIMSMILGMFNMHTKYCDEQFNN